MSSSSGVDLNRTGVSSSLTNRTKSEDGRRKESKLKKKRKLPPPETSKEEGEAAIAPQKQVIAGNNLPLFN